jgi:hypothetical protein
MLRLLWLVLVGSWRFPWEKSLPKPPPPPKQLHCRETKFGFEWSINNHPCGAVASPLCSDGRCRAHCKHHCKCEDRPLIEQPRESPSQGVPYRS